MTFQHKARLNSAAQMHTPPGQVARDRAQKQASTCITNECRCSGLATDGEFSGWWAAPRHRGLPSPWIQHCDVSPPCPDKHSSHLLQRRRSRPVLRGDDARIRGLPLTGVGECRTRPLPEEKDWFLRQACTPSPHRTKSLPPSDRSRSPATFRSTLAKVVRPGFCHTRKKGVASYALPGTDPPGGWPCTIGQLS